MIQVTDSNGQSPEEIKTIANPPSRLAHILKPSPAQAAIIAEGVKFRNEGKNALHERNKWRKPAYRIVRNLRSRLSAAVKAQGTVKADRTIKLLDCTPNQLKFHLEMYFQEGMSWSNYGAFVGGWVIDHSKPVAAHDLTKFHQQRACFHWTNLRPMWHVENMAKGDKWEEPEDLAPEIKMRTTKVRATPKTEDQLREERKAYWQAKHERQQARKKPIPAPVSPATGF